MNPPHNLGHSSQTSIRLGVYLLLRLRLRGGGDVGEAQRFFLMGVGGGALWCFLTGGGGDAVSSFLILSLGDLAFISPQQSVQK